MTGSSMVYIPFQECKLVIESDVLCHYCHKHLHMKEEVTVPTALVMTNCPHCGELLGWGVKLGQECASIIEARVDAYFKAGCPRGEKVQLDDIKWEYELFHDSLFYVLKSMATGERSPRMLSG